MQKIKRGTGFRGLLEYAADHDGGHVIGGNMAGTTPRELAREFGTARSLRADIGKPVWHNSLRLPAGEHLTDEKWQEVAGDYMHGMGFLDAHQYVLIKHDSQEGEHIHIIANRVSLVGEVYLGKNENLKSTKLISQLELTHKLHVTKGAELDHRTDLPSTKTDKRKPKKGEIERALTTGVKPARMVIQDAIDKAVTDSSCRTLQDLTNRLAEQLITVRPFKSDEGKIKGLSFTSDEASFSGSQLGEQYKYKNLMQRMEYKNEQDRGHETATNTRRIAGADQLSASGNCKDKAPDSTKQTAGKEDKGAGNATKINLEQLILIGGLKKFGFGNSSNLRYAVQTLNRSIRFLPHKNSLTSFNLFIQGINKPAFRFDTATSKIDLTANPNEQNIRMMFDLAHEAGLDDPAVVIYGDDIEYLQLSAAEAARRGIMVDFNVKNGDILKKYHDLEIDKILSNNSPSVSKFYDITKQKTAQQIGHTNTSKPSKMRMKL